MRRVQVFKQEQRERSPEEQKKIPMGYYWEKIPDYQGDFVGYGVDVEEVDTGIASFTAAIVEKRDGTVDLVPLHLIQFI